MRKLLFYGIEPDSKYVKIDFADTGAENSSDADAEVYISKAYADKFLLHTGDTITLKEKYEKDEYSFRIVGIYDYTAALCVFMPRSELNEIFDLGDDYYSGYFSDTEITDIKDQYIGSVS